MKAYGLQIHNMTTVKGDEKKRNTCVIVVFYYRLYAQEAERENSKHIQNIF